MKVGVKVLEKCAVVRKELGEELQLFGAICWRLWELQGRWGDPFKPTSYVHYLFPSKPAFPRFLFHSVMSRLGLALSRILPR